MAAITFGAIIWCVLLAWPSNHPYVQKLYIQRLGIEQVTEGYAHTHLRLPHPKLLNACCSFVFILLYMGSAGRPLVCAAPRLFVCLSSMYGIGA